MSYTIVDTYSHSPAVCMLCRGGATPAIDFTRDLDEYVNQMERLYLCCNCLRDLGRHMTRQRPEVGFVVMLTHEYAAERAAAAADRAELAEVKAALEAANDAVAALRRVDSFVLSATASAGEGSTVTVTGPVSDSRAALAVLDAPPAPAKKPRR